MANDDRFIEQNDEIMELCEKDFKEVFKLDEEDVDISVNT